MGQDSEGGDGGRNEAMPWVLEMHDDRFGALCMRTWLPVRRRRRRPRFRIPIPCSLLLLLLLPILLLLHSRLALAPAEPRRAAAKT